jgi:glyoxylase-like metal-dependent hydrolase (beta-lactamase superfamily II)
MMSTTNWDPPAPADRVTDTIWTSSGVTDSHLVVTGGGDVVINTGFHYQGQRHRERYEQALGRSLDVRKIVFTQGYFEQIGGWPHFAGPGVETIAHHNFANTLRDQRDLAAFFQPRNSHVLHPLVPTQAQAMERIYSAGDPTIDTVFHDSHAFDVGGRRFELYSVPGGEALDGLVVWVPDERVAFTGNLIGALYGALPHLYTIRGARIRSARLFLQSCQRVLDLRPDVHVTGHDEPIYGAERIQAELGKVMDAVEYIHDRTVEGMNAGTNLWTLMNDIRLPPELEPLPGRGPVWWYVRTIWEEYSGWARFESTTELYPVPPSSVWGDLVEMAGGVDRIAERAAQHLDGGEPLQAIHLTDMALSMDSTHRRALEVHAAAHELLLDHAGDNFDELGYLETEVQRARAALGAANP